MTNDLDFALVHVPTRHRKMVASLWSLDTMLSDMVAATTQPIVGQLRLTWWHERLTALPTAPAGEPRLAALALAVAQGVDGADLARLVEGWEATLEPLPLGDDDLISFATGRGATLFRLTAQIMHTPAPPDRAGEGWALVDFAMRCSDSITRARALTLADGRLASNFRHARPLRILTQLALGDLRDGVRGPRSRSRLWRAVL